METSEGIWAYFAVFGALVAAGLGFPIPEEIPVIVGGGMAAAASTHVPREHPYWFILWPVCILGVVIADGLLYGIGRLGGRRLLTHPIIERWFLRPEKRAKTEENVHKYGIMILLGARFLPGIRAGVFIIAGTLRMPLVRFLIADGLYAIPGVSLLFFLSFWFTDRFKDLFSRLHDRVEGFMSLLAVVAIAYGAGLYTYSYWKRRVETGDPSEVPILKAVIHPQNEPSPEDGEKSLTEKKVGPPVIGAEVSPIKSLIIPRLIHDAMIAQARTELPNECCGLLAGRADGRVTRHLPLINAIASTSRFESSPESMLAAMKQVREHDLQVLAVYHSHPATPPKPSQIDIELSHMANVATVIISLAGNSPTLAGWHLETTPPAPVELKIVD